MSSPSVADRLHVIFRVDVELSEETPATVDLPSPGSGLVRNTAKKLISKFGSLLIKSDFRIGT